MPFPKDFTWGVASAAFQVEGSPQDDGRGRCVWDEFCDTPGNVFQGHSGKRACGSYTHAERDVELISDLGCGGYRFSISWPRLIPDGVGAHNEQGFAYYDRLIDMLLEKGVTPWVTLYHWDLPIALHEKGGWQNPECVEWFAQYARAVVDRYSDRVSNWFTLNEPQIFLGHGYSEGTHAPGLKLSRKEVLQTAHNALMAHGRAVQIIREHAKSTPTIGFAPAGNTFSPETDSEADVEAARKATFTVQDEGWIFNHNWFADPVVLGGYPEQGLKLFGDDAPKFTDADLELIKQPLDIFGVNIYTGGVIRAGADGEPEVVKDKDGFPTTMFRWTINPRSLYYGPKFLQERYKLPVVISENGLASMDWVHADGKVHDAGRIDFLTRYLSELRRASEDGVDIRGYFQWSIMDNFEWAEGYALRFGLVYLDYETLERIPKDSYHWYAKVIESNGGSLPSEIQRVR